MSGPAPLLITRWTMQADRALPALARARLDERGVAELLAEAAHLGGLVAFRPDDGATPGDWGRVLAGDPAVVLALLATMDVEARASGLAAMLAQARADPGDADAVLARLVAALLRFAGELDAWLAPAENAAGLDGQAVHAALARAIDEVLAPRLRGLIAAVAAAEAAGFVRGVLPRRARLGRQWRIGTERIVEAAHAIEREWREQVLAQVADVAEAFVAAARDLRDRSAVAGGAAGGAGGIHAPHVALVMAFVESFAHVQARLNAVPRDIVRFYHDAVLRAEPRGAAPDRVALVVRPATGTRPTIARGTAFPAGKDAGGRAILFAADTALATTGATLAQVRTWTPLTQPDGTRRVESAVFDGGADGMVGDAVAGIARGGTIVPATPALLVASPMLGLTGVVRRIDVIFTGVSADAATFARYGVAMTTAAGWVVVAQPEWHDDAAGVRLTVTLGADMPAIAACPGVAAGSALRIAGEGGAVTVASVALSMTVTGLDGLVVSTPRGLASVAGAAPFGSPPFAGGWLRIDHPVLAGRLDRVAVRLDWAGVPPGAGGFADHYRGYRVDADGRRHDAAAFDNAAFAVTLAAPVRGWDAAQRLPLFASPDAPAGPPPRWGRVAPVSSFVATAGPGAVTGPAPAVDHVALTLVAPAAAFGDGVYAANVAYATMRLTQGEPLPARPGFVRRVVRALLALPRATLRKLGLMHAPDALPPVEEALPDMPNPPFVPVLSGVAVDCVWTGGVTLLHAPPFEDPRVIVPGPQVSLFAPLPTRATVDIALAGLRPGVVVALLVRLAAGAVGTPDWSYLARSGWRVLPGAALRSDATQGLAQTGIVTLAIPDDAAAVDGGPVWLRVACDVVPAILAIVPDVLMATRVVGDPAAPMSPVPAGTITKPAAMAGVTEVVQPCDAAGGRQPEDAAEMRRRVAERLRHRGRGGTCWDLERIVLEAFPAVAGVRVLAADTVIVLPAVGQGATLTPSTRAAIATRLAAVSSPFARLRVVDPVRVPVDVAARIVVTPDGVARIGADVAALLSPQSRLDLDDAAGAQALRGAIARRLRQLPHVVAIERLHVVLRETTPAPWRVPVAGTLDVVGVVTR